MLFMHHYSADAVWCLEKRGLSD